VPPPFLSLVLDGGEWSASHSSWEGEDSPDTHWTGGWVGRIASLDIMEKRKIMKIIQLGPLRVARHLSLPHHKFVTGTGRCWHIM
jgi:hypothetical protein